MLEVKYYSKWKSMFFLYNCPQAPPAESGLSSECELREDPSDPCCQVMFCPAPGSSGGAAGGAAGGQLELRPVESLAEFDGCTFKNESYAQGERFYDGCEQQCQCMGYGDMVCLAR